MKNHVLIASSLIVLTALFTALGFAAEKSSASNLNPFPTRPFVECGMDRDTVVHMIGEPGATLSSNVWVYFDFQAANPRLSRGKTNHVDSEKFDTLVIEFVRGRVSRIRWCEARPVREFLARLENRKTATAALAAR